MSWFADVFQRHRAWVGAAAALISLLAMFGASRTTIDDVPSSIFRSDDEHFERLEQVFEDFGTDDADCLVVIEGDEVLSPDGVELLRALDRDLLALDGVAAAWSLDDLLVFEEGALAPAPLLAAPGASAAEHAAAARRALEHPLASNLLLAPDGQATVVVAHLGDPHLSISEMRERVVAIRDVVARLTNGSRFSAQVTGVPPIRVVIFDSIGREQRIYPPLSGILGILIGFLIFQRPAPVLITTAASLLAAMWAVGFMGIVGQPLNLLTAQLPLLVMVIAFTDAIHLMIDTLRRRADGFGALEAAAQSIRDLGLPCALTSLTTAIGFGSLVVSRIEVIQRFGGVFAAAVGMSFLVVLTCVPLGTSLFLRESRRPTLALRFAGLHAPAERLIRVVLRRPRPVFVGGALVTLALLAIALQLVPENRLTESTPRGDGAVDALHTLERHFGGALSASVLVEWPDDRSWDDPETLAVLAGVDRILEESDFTHAPRSVLDLVALLPTALQGPAGMALLPSDLVGRYLRADVGRALVTALVPDAGTGVCDPAYNALDARLEELRAAHPDFQLNLTGTGYIARRNVNLIIRDFTLGLALAAGVIFVVLSVAFRSFTLGLLSLLPNAFPLVVAAALLALAGIELQVSSVLGFTVLLGIAVDDTIHYVSRYKRELARDGDVDEALVRAFLGVGRALAMTTVSLGAGFAVSLTSVLPTSQLFALIVVIGLLAALVGDLILLPAAIASMARREGASRNRTESGSGPAGSLPRGHGVG